MTPFPGNSVRPHQRVAEFAGRYVGPGTGPVGSEVGKSPPSLGRSRSSPSALKGRDAKSDIPDGGVAELLPEASQNRRLHQEQFLCPGSRHHPDVEACPLDPFDLASPGEFLPDDVRPGPNCPVGSGRSEARPLVQESPGHVPDVFQMLLTRPLSTVIVAVG